tara:strand:+ start:168 stop:344 length:177 start_codon:yes stop_codon:yes gene_type:complete
MTQILEKIEEVKAELQQVVDEHNQLLEQKNAALQRFTELQGALKTLQELEETDGGENN